MTCSDVSCRFCKSVDVYYTTLLCNLTKCSDYKTDKCPLKFSDCPENFPDSCLIKDAYTENQCSLSRCIDWDD